MMLAISRLRWRREGAPLPGRGVVLVANHASYVDIPLLMAALPGDFRFVAKQEVRSWPVLGWLVRRTQHLTVDRFDAGRGLADYAATVEALRAGDNVLFFPEGTFEAATGLRPFRLGAFQAAVEAGVGVVPIAVTGARRALRGETAIPRRGELSVTIGEPLRAEGTDWAATLRLRDAAADWIAARCGEPRLDLRSGGPLRP
jgi:1-acyl-sn-glycerol-3-phosphate acyltransferase